MKKLALFLATIAPGIFLIGYNIGTGSITTMAVAGAAHGMTLVWPLLLSCIFTYFLIVIFGEYTAVTGQTILYSFKNHFGKGLALFALISFLISEWVACMGVMGIVADVSREWTKSLSPSGEGFHPVWFALFFGAILYFIFWNGRHRFFERILMVFVTLMGLCFVLSMFMVIPDPSELLRNIQPSIPTDSESFLLVAGMVGTTMGAILYVVRSILVQEKGWTEKDLKIKKRDALISAGMMFLLSVAVMASAAGTLHPLGKEVEKAIDMVHLLEPIAGQFAVSLFIVGIICAGLSSLFPIILLAPWLIADYEGNPRDMQSARTRWLVLFGVCLGLVVPLVGGRPVFIMVLSQATTIVATPLVLLLMQILINKPEVMGAYKAGTSRNIFMGVVFLFTLVMAIFGFIGIGEEILKMINGIP